MNPATKLHLQELGLHPGQFAPSANNSLRGPCPNCGGHRRLVVYLNGEWPRWYLKCDLCGYAGWAYILNPKLHTKDIEDNPPTSTPGRAVDLARIEKLLDNLPDMVQQMHDNMSEENKSWWEKAGVPADYQLFWELGYIPNRAIFDRTGSLIKVSAYSIPKHDLGWHKLNVDFRLIGAPLDCGKYRPIAGLPPAPFIARPDFATLDNDGVAYVVEGSKKAMVSCVFLDNAQVIGVPSNNSWCNIQERLNGTCDRVFVVLDPDSWVSAHRLCRLIGPKARQVTLPGKIDDLILSGSLSRAAFERILKMSR